MESLYQPAVRLGNRNTVGTGWMPPMPDPRDYTEESPAILGMSRKLGLVGKKAVPVPVI